jgi:glycosyltransferase involved in cell wall biosynthesis
MDDIIFSVVIPTYNRRKELGQCLDALAQQSLSPSSYEVIIVDDGSTDGTSEYCHTRTFPCRLACISIPNGGASGARNAGIAIAHGRYIAFTEDDVVADRDWLSNALKHLGDGAIEVLEGRTRYLHTGKDVRRFEKSRLPSFIPCNLIVRRTVFDRIGGYDPAFYDTAKHLYFREDADLGFRILDAGFRVELAQDVRVAHPPQFSTLGECVHHARRYVFDPLLYTKHPRRFREMIEVKRIFGLEVHRPQHYLALLYVVSLVALAGTLAWWGTESTLALAILAFGCSFLFRFKYQGWRAFRLYEVRSMLGFLVVPLVYLASVLKGCVIYKTWGPLA